MKKPSTYYNAVKSYSTLLKEKDELFLVRSIHGYRDMPMKEKHLFLIFLIIYFSKYPYIFLVIYLPIYLIMYVPIYLSIALSSLKPFAYCIFVNILIIDISLDRSYYIFFKDCLYVRASFITSYIPLLIKILSIYTKC